MAFPSEGQTFTSYTCLLHRTHAVSSWDYRGIVFICVAISASAFFAVTKRIALLFFSEQFISSWVSAKLFVAVLDRKEVKFWLLRKHSAPS